MSVIPPPSITITEQHIGDGLRHDCAKYPVALAVAEAIGTPPDWPPWFPDVAADTEVIGVQFPAEQWEADTPPAVADFMADFDGGREVSPFTFELDWRLIPEPEAAA